MVESVDAGAQAAVQAEDLAVDQGSQGQVVEQVREILPDVGVAVLPETLVVESVDLGDLAGLVVAAQYRDALAIADLEGHEQGDGLDGVVSSVDVVAHEEVIRVWRFATNPEELHEIVKLSVNVTADGDRALHLLDVRLLRQNLFGLLAKGLDIGFRELLAIHQLFDPAVQLLELGLLGRVHDVGDDRGPVFVNGSNSDDELGLESRNSSFEVVQRTRQPKQEQQCTSDLREQMIEKATLLFGRTEDLLGTDSFRG